MTYFIYNTKGNQLPVTWPCLVYKLCTNTEYYADCNTARQSKQLTMIVTIIEDFQIFDQYLRLVPM